MTKWYCDRCGKDFNAHYKLKRIEVSVGNLLADDFVSKNGEFCNDCYNKLKEKLLSELLYREKNVTCSKTAQVERLRKAAEETEDNGVRKGILKAIEVLEGDTELQMYS